MPKQFRKGETGESKMTTFAYEAVRLNGQNGYIVTRRIDGVHAGKAFGKTKTAARAALES